MSASVISVSNGNNGLAGTALTAVVTAPTSISSGNLLFAVVSSDGSTTFTSSGWAVKYTIPSGLSGTTPSFTILFKVATGSEPSTYTFTSSSANGFLVSIANITGQDATTPFNGYFYEYSSTTSATAGATSGTPSIPTTLNCLPIAIFSLQHLSPSNTVTPTGLTSGWTAFPLNVVQDTSNYTNSGNQNGYSPISLAYGPLTSSTSTAVTASCTWGGSSSTHDDLSVMLFINSAASAYGTLTASPSSVGILGAGTALAQQVTITETSYTGSFIVTVPTSSQGIISVSTTQFGTYGTSCSISGPSSSFWVQEISTGSASINVSGG